MFRSYIRSAGLNIDIHPFFRMASSIFDNLKQILSYITLKWKQSYQNSAYHCSNLCLSKNSTSRCNNLVSLNRVIY